MSLLKPAESANVLGKAEGTDLEGSVRRAVELPRADALRALKDLARPFHDNPRLLDAPGGENDFLAEVVTAIDRLPPR